MSPSGAVLLPNLGAEEPQAPRGAAVAAIERVTNAWSALFGAATEVIVAGGGSEPARWPASLGDRPERPAFDWLEDSGGGVAWLPTRRAVAQLEGRGLRVAGPSPDVVRAVHDKAFAVRHAPQPDELSPMLHALSPAELREPAVRRRLAGLVDAWPAWARRELTLKPRLGTSGRGRVSGPVERLADGTCERLAARGGAVLEPWLARREDFSVQLHVTPAGAVNVVGTTRQLLRPNGTVLGNRGTLDAAGAASSGSPHDPALREAARQVGRAAARRGFFGPCGTDGFTYVSGADGAVRMRPVVELNARFTTGLVALGLVARARPLLPSARAWALLYAGARSTRRLSRAPGERPAGSRACALEASGVLVVLAESEADVDDALARAG